MDKNDPVFQEFCGYWQLSEEMIAKASKDDLAETARILAMQAAHMTRKYGAQELPDLAHLLSATTLDNESIALLRELKPEQARRRGGQLDPTLWLCGQFEHPPALSPVDRHSRRDRRPPQ